MNQPQGFRRQDVILESHSSQNNLEWAGRSGGYKLGYFRGPDLRQLSKRRLGFAAPAWSHRIRKICFGNVAIFMLFVIVCFLSFSRGLWADSLTH